MEKENKDSEWTFVGDNGKEIPYKSVNWLDIIILPEDMGSIYISSTIKNKEFIENIEQIKDIFLCGNMILIDAQLEKYFKISIDEDVKSYLSNNMNLTINLLNEKMDDIIRKVNKKIIIL